MDSLLDGTLPTHRETEKDQIFNKKAIKFMLSFDSKEEEDIIIDMIKI